MGMWDLSVVISSFFVWITVIFGPLFSRVLSAWIGKPHKILQSTDFKNFFWRIYHFSALLYPYFPHSFQYIILVMLLCLTCLQSFSASFEDSKKICAIPSAATPHTRQIDWTFFHRPQFSYSLYRRPGLVLLY